MTTATAEKTAARVAPKFDPAQGSELEFVSRRRRFYMPAGMTAQDLQDDPSIWATVQGNRDPLQALDELQIISDDGQTFISAIVQNADSRSASIVILAKKELAPRPSFEDEKYRVVWGASPSPGYRVVRKSDNRKMTTPVPDLPAAMLDLRTMYPRSGDYRR
jgi:hypothetical protein